jgi:hypothetical protein
MARRASGEAQERRLIKAMQKLTAEELAELYVCGDWDVHSATLKVWHTRPADALVQGLRLARSRSKRRRERSYWLIAVGDDGTGVADEALAGLLKDKESSVIANALSGFGILQVGRSGREFGRRIDAQKQNPALVPWPEPMPARIDLELVAPFAVHPEPWLRMHVPMTLMMCGDERATSILLQLARDQDGDVRAAAFHSLGWKDYTGGVTANVIDALWAGATDGDVTVRCDAVCALMRLHEPGAEEAYAGEVRKAIERNASHGAIYPLVNMLYDPLSACLPADVREEACRRWAKPLVGKPVPSMPASKSSRTVD